MSADIKQVSLGACDLREAGVAADSQEQMCMVRGCCWEAPLGRWPHYTT